MVTRGGWRRRARPGNGSHRRVRLLRGGGGPRQGTRRAFLAAPRESRRYGRVFLESLPEARLVGAPSEEAFAELAAFFRRGGAVS